MRYLHLAMLAASTAFSQGAIEESSSVNMARQLAIDTQVDYPVEAYICLDDSSEVKKPAALWLGAKLQVCVKIDETVVTENIIVEDILTFVISQPDGTANDWETITNAIAVPMTNKTCHESGICHVKSHLLPRFFNDKSPGDLRVDGIAILAIGRAPIISSSALTAEGATPNVRRLRAPIRGLLTSEDVKAFTSAQHQQHDGKETATASVLTDPAQRMLQDGPALSEFSLEVVLKGVNSGGSSYIRDTVLVVAMLVAGSCVIVWLCAECSRRDDKNEIMRFNSNTTNVQSTFRNNGTARARVPSPSHHIRTIECNSNSQCLAEEENMTDSEQESTERGRSRGRSRWVEKEEITRHASESHPRLDNNDSTARAKIPSSCYHTGTLNCTSTDRPIFAEAIGRTDSSQQSVDESEVIVWTDPDQQSTNKPSNPIKGSGTTKLDSRLGETDFTAQAKVPSSDVSHKEKKEQEMSSRHSIAKNHSSLRKSDSAARAITLSSAAKAARPSLVLTRSAVESETSLRVELKALFEEKELKTAINCHTFFSQHFVNQDNIKIMSYSTFSAFMNETRAEPLKKRHKQQLQMLLANNTETQRASSCASLPIESQQSDDLTRNVKNTSKAICTKMDASLKNNDSAARTITLSPAAKAARPSLVLTRFAVDSETSLLIELKALFEEKELTTATHCHTFFSQHLANQGNIKIMSYSTFIAFMNGARAEPLKKRHKQQLQMLLADNTETQRASSCASLPMEDQKVGDLPRNPKDTFKESGNPKIDSSVKSNDSALQAKMPSSGRPSLALTRSAAESETFLRIELKALFEEKELTTAMHCHSFFKQHFANQDNIKIMSYSAFIAFMNEAHAEPLRKRHKQQLQMLLANNTETQRVSKSLKTLKSPAVPASLKTHEEREGPKARKAQKPLKTRSTPKTHEGLRTPKAA
jgi:hypothetical protein